MGKVHIDRERGRPPKKAAGKHAKTQRHQPAQIQPLLSGDTLSGLAEKLGVDPEQASGMVAQYLPGLVDSLTPDGIVPEGGADLASQGVALLKGFFK